MDTTPGIHSIQDAQQVRQNVSVSEPYQLPIDEPSTSREVVPVKFIVKPKVPQNHIEELNFRLQRANQTATVSDDINPSIGDTSDKDSDVNIQQLESTVSSLDGHTSSTITSPEIARSKKRTKQPTATIAYKSIETDF